MPIFQRRGAERIRKDESSGPKVPSLSRRAVRTHSVLLGVPWAPTPWQAEDFLNQVCHRSEMCERDVILSNEDYDRVWPASELYEMAFGDKLLDEYVCLLFFNSFIKDFIAKIFMKLI